MSPLLNNTSVCAMHCVEGFAIVLLCQLRSQIKKMAISLLKEVKQILQLLNCSVMHKIYAITNFFSNLILL